MAKVFRGSQVFGREAIISQSIQIVDAGQSAWLVGGRLSGRTTVIRELKKRLEENNWTCIEFSGFVGLASVPLASLNIVRDGSAYDQRGRWALPDVAQHLRSLMRPPRTVLLIDDADELDEASIGLIGAIARETSCSIIATCLALGHLQHSLPFSAATHGFKLTLDSVGFDDLERIIRDRIGAPVAVDTMSRIFAKSSGIVGVACAIADNAMLEQRILHNSDYGVWQASENLWSATLDGVVVMYVQALSADETEALETIALAGIIDVSTARKIVPAQPLESLEAHGLVRTAMRGNRQIVSVVPAIVAESIRARSNPLHRARLADQLSSHVSDTEAMVHATSGLPSSDRGAIGAFDPVRVRLHIEHVQAALVSARAAWHENPSALTATAYARSLMNAGGEPEQVDFVFETTSTESCSHFDRAEYAVLRAEWRGIAQNDLAAALDLLADERGALDGGYEKLIDASAVRLECLLGTVPSDYADTLVTATGDPEVVRTRLDETLMFVLLVVGRLGDARRAFERILDEHAKDYRSPANEQYGWLLMAEGKHSAAVEWNRQSFEGASNDLDAASMLPQAYLRAVLAISAGEYAVADDVLARVFAMGSTSPTHAHAQLGLWVIETFLMVRRESEGIDNRFPRGPQRHGVSFGPMMGQSVVIASAQMDVHNGKVEAAVEDIWAEGERAWHRGHRLASMQLMLMAAEMKPTSTRRAVIRARITEVEGQFLHSFAGFLEAREANNGAELVRLATTLTDTGRPGLAAVALDLAERFDGEQGTNIDKQIRTARTALVEKTGGRRLDMKRFLVSAASFTDREREIVDLVSRRMSNPEIATRLVLSVRTVESHLSRILKKAEVRSRAELIERYTGSGGRARPNLSI